MTCNRIEELLPAYIENDLSSEDRAAVERHLASCHSCRAAFADFERLEGSLGALRGAVPSRRAAQERFRRRIGLERRSAFVRILLAPSVAAGIAIAAAAAVFLPRGREIAGALAPFGTAAASWSAGFGGVFARLVDALAEMPPVLLSAIYGLAAAAVMLGNMRFALRLGRR